MWYAKRLEAGMWRNASDAPGTGRREAEAMSSPEPGAAALFPLFLKLAGRKVLVVGGGPVATAKVRTLLDAHADVHLVAPSMTAELEALAEVGNITVARRSYEARDLEGVWLVVVAAPVEVARVVAEAAESQRRFVLAVDETSAASAYGAGTLRRGGVTIAVSTDGRAPALAGLLREGLEAVLPEELADWTAEAERRRAAWKAEAVPMASRRPLLLEALNKLYGDRGGRRE
jgi:uroporphyrin-III C-methyltransferase/precorrin-2 dehydrogenase/sirohydrochlorin ferrochelatase